MEGTWETKNHLEKAWRCIMKQYRKKVIDDSRKEGAGICIFLMKPEVKGSPFNCQYHYIFHGENMWKKYLGYSPLGEVIEKEYDHDKMYLVSVHVPDTKDSTHTIGSIRGFYFDSNAEVRFGNQ